MNPNPEKQRLFFALWPDETVRGALAQWARAQMPRHGRPVAPENLHLTLVFLGSVAAEMRDCLVDAVGTIRCPPFELCLDQAGWFQRPQVYWVGASQTPAPLLALVAELQRAQSQCGGEPESRPFRAHVTLARKVRRRPPPAAAPRLRWPVDRFALVSSQTLPQGPVYQPECTWMLQV